MLRKEFRLKKESDFKLLFSKGRGVFHNIVGIKYRKNGLKSSRVGVVVGTKISKSAVKRNIIKRKIRIIVKKHWNEILPGFDIVFIARPDSFGKKYSELEDVIEFVLKKSGLVKER